MPVIAPAIGPLNRAYNDLVNLNTDLTRAVASVAPAAVQEVLCTAGGLASLGAGPFGQFQGPGTPGRLLSDFGGILQAACPVPPPLPPVPAPPFTGGQCDDIRYVVVFRREGGGVPPDDIALNSWGPVSPLTVQEVPNGQDLYFFERRSQQGGPTTPVTVQGSDRNNEGTARIVSATPIGGAPDICGDPPTVNPPRPPITQPPPSPDIPTIDPDGNPGNPIVIQPTIGPIFIDADATIKVPVSVRITGGDINNEITIPVSVSLPDLNVDFNFGGSGGGGTSNPGEDEPSPPMPICCPPPQPRLEEGEDENPEDPPPEPEQTEEIIGAVVTSTPTEQESRASQLGLPKPDLFVPRIATAQFEVLVDGNQAYAPDVQVKSVSQYIPAPDGVTVSRILVGWEQGWEGEIRYLKRIRNIPSMEEA